MAHLHKKVKKGRPYYYLREIRRVNGKPTVVSQIYLGSPETMAKRLKEAQTAKKPVRLHAREFGALFVAHEFEKMLDSVGIIDGIVSRGARERGPTVGEYFFYAWANRLIAPKSKRALADWYRKTAIQEIRPVVADELSSARYWEKWERVTAEDVEKIGQAFFAKVWQMQALPPECLLFDTTNYYAYLDSQTSSELCQRGHNKAGKHHLRQLGLALLVNRATQLPLYCKLYAGNTHDSKLFRQVMDEMFGVMCGFNQTKQRLTVVFDKGMNSEEAIGHIDDHPRIHFITTCSTYFAEELAGTDLSQFTPLATEKNRLLEQQGKECDRLLAFRSRKELWGKERTVVVTYNPRTARKKQHALAAKLDAVRERLLEFQRKYREQQPHWRHPQAIGERYRRLCEQMHIGSQYYQLRFGDNGDKPEMSFRKDPYQVAKAKSLFGKNIIVTDNHDWTTEEIVQASLDRWAIEKQFRASKSCEHVRVNPFFHWTDSKIRCHLLTCIIALTVLQLLEMNGRQHSPLNEISGRQIMDELRSLHSIGLWYSNKTQPERLLETPSKIQAEVLKALGWQIDSSGVLQNLTE